MIDISKDEEKKSYIFNKSSIVHQSKNTSVYEEGCLSLPGQFAEIERPAECTVRFINYDGKEKELKTDGFSDLCSAWNWSFERSTIYRLPIQTKKRYDYKKLVKQKKEIERVIV